MDSIQKGRWETAMAIFHYDPIQAYERAIERHKRAVKRIQKLIKKLKEERR